MHGVSPLVLPTLAQVDYPDDYEKQVAEKRKRLDEHLNEAKDEGMKGGDREPRTF